MVSPIYTGGPAIRLMLATNSVKRRGRRLRVGEALLLATSDSVKPFLLEYFTKLEKWQNSAGYSHKICHIYLPYLTFEYRLLQIFGRIGRNQVRNEP